MTCPHDLAERETACADGMCPICAADEIERWRSRFEDLQAVSFRRASEVERLRAELEQMREEWNELVQVAREGRRALEHKP